MNEQQKAEHDRLIADGYTDNGGGNYSKITRTTVTILPKLADKPKVMSAVSDLVGSFLYYDRKEDEELPRGEIERMIADSEITVAQIVNEFGDRLKEGLK